MFKAQIRQENGIPQLYMNDKPTAPMLLWLNTKNRQLDDLNRSQAAAFAQLGMHLYSNVADLPLSGNDFESCKAAMRCIIAGDPEAKILLRITASPFGEEAEAWCEKHPEDKMVWNVVHTTPYNNGMVNETSMVGNAPVYITVASDEWFATAQQAVVNLCRELDRDPEFSDHLLGIHVGGGESYEWFHYGLRERGIDYSKTNGKKYAQWRIAKRGPDCDTALPEDLPGNDRMELPDRTLLTKKTDDRFTDYAEYSSWLMSERILTFAHTLRKELGTNRLVVFFYGYLFELYDPRTGHFMLNRILESPDIDALTSPISYTDRVHGGVGALMSPADSITAHGKLWIVENDVRSPNIIRSLDPGYDPTSDWVDKVNTIENMNEVIKREAGQMLIHGLGCWYMDLGGLGWHHHPMIWKQIGDLHALYTKMQPHLRPASPEVALLVDEDGMFYQGHADFLGVNLLYRTRLSLYRAGVEFGMYTARDFENDRIPSAKVAFYLSPFAISKDRADRIRKIAAKNHTTLIFMHGFGVTDPAVVKELTGMEIQTTEEGLCNLAMEGSRVLWQDARWGDQLANPATWVASGGEPLATYTQGTLSGKTAAAWGNGEGYSVLFVGATELSAEAMRHLCRIGGAHIYCETDDTFLCGNGFYMIHTSLHPGVRTIRLPEKKELISWPEGDIFSTDTLMIDRPAKTQIWIEKTLWDAK